MTLRIARPRPAHTRTTKEAVSFFFVALLVFSSLSSKNLPSPSHYVSLFLENGDSSDDSSDDSNEPKKPNFPLRRENLEIVQMAVPINTSYVDVSDDHKEHPHMGAKGEDGKLGYIHDETALRRNPPAFSFESKKEEEMACAPRDSHWKMMTKRVKVELEYDHKLEKSGVKRDKIFCLVFTTEQSHDKIPSIRVSSMDAISQSMIVYPADSVLFAGDLGIQMWRVHGGKYENK